MSTQDVFPSEGVPIGDLREWDNGLFSLELVHMGVFPIPASDRSRAILGPAEGTLGGTQMALTQLFQRIETRFGSYFDVANFESSIPQDLKFSAKKDLYDFQVPGSDPYPPHLAVIPKADQTGLLDIFNAMALADTASLIPQIIPQSWLYWFHANPEGSSMAGITAKNEELIREDKDIYTSDNVGNDRPWYTDSVFAQQQLTGVNPTTLTLASSDWIQQFQTAAQAQSKGAMVELITSATGSLYIQDCSYFRQAVGVGPNNELKSEDGEIFACAPVSLFHLQSDGKLHPLAIVIDFKTSIANSVVIFNRRLRASDPLASEETDWPWRYAKTCAQVGDWIRHEVTVHLTNTHFVEEVVIVAAHRSFPTKDPVEPHPVYQLLSPHWLKTLSLNAAARATLVPSVITEVIGFTTKQTYAFIRDAYSRFDWTKQYIPNDLAARGFPADELLTSPKFHNYAYGKNMTLMWQVLRTFVSTALSVRYKTDSDVVNDPAIGHWVQEMQRGTGGNMSSFPNIKTIDELVDAVVMCIHIASPQHTAVNYLQEFYLCFLPNKPPALCARPPTNLETLLAFKEKDLMKALPLGRPREWLLATHLPHLLSYQVAKDQNLPTYARSLERLAKDPVVSQAAKTLYDQLMELGTVFDANSDALDDQSLPYHVMNPEVTAVSILI
jgi:hypothetical protein